MIDFNACDKDTFTKIKELVWKVCHVIRVSSNLLNTTESEKKNR